MSENDAKNKIIDLYLFLKIRKSEEIEKITKEDIEKEKNNLIILPLDDIINYIKNSIETLIELKACQKFEEKLLYEESKKTYHNYEDKNDENGLILYEGMLIKAEKDIRKHIRVNKILFLIIIFNIQIEQELKIRLEDLENELNDIKLNKGLVGKNYKTYIGHFFLDSVNKKDNLINTNKKEKTTTTTTNHKEKAIPNTSNNSKTKQQKLIEKNKLEKNNELIIKKLEKENDNLRKLLITYKLKKSKYEKSTEKINKFYNYFEKKISKINSKNNINKGNLSNIFTLNNNSLNSNYQNLSNSKNSFSNHLLDNIIDKISSIQKKNKNTKINTDSCSILLTEGNKKKNKQKRQYKDLNSNSKNNKILITEIKLNKTNSKIRKVNKSKMNSIYYNRNNINKNNNDVFDINKNNIINQLGNPIFKTNFVKKKRTINLNMNKKYNYKRNRMLSIKSSHHSLKIEKNNPNLLKLQNDNNLNHNNTNKIFPYGKKKLQNNIKSFNKNYLSNIITHNSVNNTSTKINNLFDKRRNLKLNKKKNKNYHSISSVTDKKINNSNINSSISFNFKKLKLNENEKSINKSLNNYTFEQYVKHSEKISHNKEKKDTQKLKYFVSYSSKVKKFLNENANKNLKNIKNNTIKNDNPLINSIKKKNNIFFTINKTIIHNMNNTFNNSNNKHYVTNINNSTEDVNNNKQFSPILLKNSNDDINLYNGINLKKKILSRCHISSNYNISNNNRFPVLRTSVNDKSIKNVQNKGKKLYK